MGISKGLVFLIGIHLSNTRIQTINIDSNDLESSKLLLLSLIGDNLSMPKSRKNLESNVCHIVDIFRTGMSPAFTKLRTMWFFLGWPMQQKFGGLCSLL